MAIDVSPFRVREGHKVSLKRWPTRVRPFYSSKAHYQELLKLIPYKRIGEADEIGRAAVWLASDYADYIHGISLFVDGGMTLYPGFETGG